MDMRQIRQFIAVVEHRNMLRAAQAIHLSQPALTKSIKNLEEELGVQLLTRGPRGVTPTIYGDVLLRRARLLTNESERAVEEIRELKAGHAGHVRLGVANFSIAFLPRVMAQLLTSMPGLSFEIVDGTYDGLTALVREGALDAVASGFPMVHRAEDLVHEALVDGEFLLVCRPDHPILTRQTSAQAIADQRWIVANRPRQIVEVLEFTFRNAGVTPPKPVIQSGSMSFLKAVLLEGEFLTVLPRGVVRAELESGSLVSVSFMDLTFPTVEGIIYRAQAVLPPALFVLIAAVRSAKAAEAGPRALHNAAPKRRTAGKRNASGRADQPARPPAARKI